MILVGIILMSRLPSTSVSIGQVTIANGKPAPTIDLIPLTDSDSLTSLNELPLGKVILLHFWGTWCTPCKLEYPELAAMARQWESSSRFQFISVSCESNGSETLAGLKQKTIEYFESAEVKSFAYSDPLTITRRSLGERFERDSMFLPTSILIQPDGSIAGAWEGYSEGGVAEIDQAIKSLMNR